MTVLIAIIVRVVFLALIVALLFFINRSRKLAEDLSKAGDSIQRQQRTLASIIGKFLALERARKAVEASRDDIATVTVLLADRAAEVLRIDETDTTAAKWRLLRPIRSVISILAGGDFSQIRAEVLKNAREQERKDNVDFITQIANRDSQRVIRQWRERAGRGCTCPCSGKGGDVADIHCPRHGLKADAIRRELVAMTTNDDSQPEPVRCTQCGLTEAEDPHEHGCRDHALRYPDDRPEPFMKGVQRPPALWCSYCGQATDHATRDCNLLNSTPGLTPTELDAHATKNHGGAPVPEWPTCSVCRRPFNDKCLRGKCVPITEDHGEQDIRGCEIFDVPGCMHVAHIRERYSELILAVESKWPGETRHQTALRYIQQAENRLRDADKKPVERRNRADD